ncbi:hypothetical protein M0812_10814 [Anaeramoeba flamelloides]|uniref:Uncharacterized protein n=1 Tax=Anaeramoeba flamelloides TaxID=1746091 RepID=A0AAV7ZWG9_9EUKA|nr:hypothetical protein M0812_10814 [Anaeramoeba flamelloides]
MNEFKMKKTFSSRVQSTKLRKKIISFLILLLFLGVVLLAPLTRGKHKRKYRQKNDQRILFLSAHYPNDRVKISDRRYVRLLKSFYKEGYSICLGSGLLPDETSCSNYCNLNKNSISEQFLEFEKSQHKNKPPQSEDGLLNSLNKLYDKVSVKENKEVNDNHQANDENKNTENNNDDNKNKNKINNNNKNACDVLYQKKTFYEKEYLIESYLSLNSLSEIENLDFDKIIFIFSPILSHIKWLTSLFLEARKELPSSELITVFDDLSWNKYIEAENQGLIKKNSQNLIFDPNIYDKLNQFEKFELQKLHYHNLEIYERNQNKDNNNDNAKEDNGFGKENKEEIFESQKTTNKLKNINQHNENEIENEEKQENGNEFENERENKMETGTRNEIENENKISKTLSTYKDYLKDNQCYKSSDIFQPPWEFQKLIGLLFAQESDRIAFLHQTNLYKMSEFLPQRRERMFHLPHSVSTKQTIKNENKIIENNEMLFYSEDNDKLIIPTIDWFISNVLETINPQLRAHLHIVGPICKKLKQWENHKLITLHGVIEIEQLEVLASKMKILIDPRISNGDEIDPTTIFLIQRGLPIITTFKFSIPSQLKQQNNENENDKENNDNYFDYKYLENNKNDGYDHDPNNDGINSNFKTDSEYDSDFDFDNGKKYENDGNDHKNSKKKIQIIKGFVVCQPFDNKCFLDNINLLFRNPKLWEIAKDNLKKTTQELFHKKSIEKEIKGMSEPLLTENKESVFLSIIFKETEKLNFKLFEKELFKFIKQHGKNHVFIRSIFLLNNNNDDNYDDKNNNNILREYEIKKQINELKKQLKKLGFNYLFTIFDNDHSDGINYGDLMNIALESISTDFNLIIFINDIQFTSKKIYQLINTPVNYDLVCGMDFAINDNNELAYNNLLETRDLSGDIFTYDEPWVQHSQYQQNIELGIPFQVYTCWSSLVAVKAAPFLKERLRFRYPFKKECQSEMTELLSKDLWRYGYNKVFINPVIQLSKTEEIKKQILKSKYHQLVSSISTPNTQMDIINNHPMQPLSMELPDFKKCCYRYYQSQLPQCSWYPNKNKLTIGIYGNIFENSFYTDYNKRIATMVEQRLKEDVDLMLFPTTKLTFPLKTFDLEQFRISEQIFFFEKNNNLNLNIHSSWPPNFELPLSRKGKTAIVLSWKYGSLPISWISNLNKFDEVWVTSSYEKKNFISDGVEEPKILVMPKLISDEFFKARRTPRMGSDRFLVTSKKKTRYLFYGDPTYENGIDIIVDVFKTTFVREDNVSLTIVSNNKNGYYSKVISQWDNSVLPELNWVSDFTNLTPSEMIKMFESATHLVAPFRTWSPDLPIFEAATSALPIILTTGGPPMDFANSENSFLIISSKVPCIQDPCVNGKKLICFNKDNYPLNINNNDLQLQSNQDHCEPTVHFPFYFEPNSDYLASLLLYTSRNQEIGEKFGNQARRTISTLYSLSNIQKRIHQEVN